MDRQRPGQGYRHLLTKQQVYQFIDILPDWGELSRGLNAVVLAPGDESAMGWHRPGVVAVCAWDADLECEWDTEFLEPHQDVLLRLGVPKESIYHTLEDEQFARPDPLAQLCRFTERSARGFQLMHVFLHELGHHHDRMTTRSRRRASRGESYAEQYAIRYGEQIWESYFKVFGW